LKEIGELALIYQGGYAVVDQCLWVDGDLVGVGFVFDGEVADNSEFGGGVVGTIATIVVRDHIR
jgi:hypothetical protein